MAFYFLSSLSAACSIYSGNIIVTEDKSNIGSNAALRVNVIDELEIKNFCLDSQITEDITAWYFSREDTLIKQAIFYKSENKLILKIGDQTSGYLNAYSYQNPRYGDLPHFCFEQNSAVSLTAHLSGVHQELFIADVQGENLKRRIYELPLEADGLELAFYNEEPILINDSLIILRLFYPSLRGVEDASKKYSTHVDAIFKLDKDNQRAEIVDFVGYYPRSYREYDFNVQDYFPQRILVDNKLYYSFKNYDDIIVYDLNELKNISNFEIDIDSDLDLAPMRVTMDDHMSSEADFKLAMEPGYLSLRYFKEQNVFLRLYKPRMDREEVEYKLYDNDFFLLVYDENWNLIKKHFYKAVPFRASLGGDKNLLYFIHKNIHGKEGCIFDEIYFE